jgi:hypothetical protein
MVAGFCHPFEACLQAVVLSALLLLPCPVACRVNQRRRVGQCQR